VNAVGHVARAASDDACAVLSDEDPSDASGQQTVNTLTSLVSGALDAD